MVFNICDAHRRLRTALCFLAWTFCNVFCFSVG